MAINLSKIAMLVSCIALASCIQGSESDENLEAYRAQIEPNGIRLNGLRLNGLRLNGLKLNGLKLNGLKLNGLKLNGLKLNGVDLNKATISSIRVDGSLLKGFVEPGHIELVGTEWIGAVWDIAVDNPDGSSTKSYQVRIDDVSLSTANKFGDVWLYSLSSQESGTQGWQSLCTDYTGAPDPATIFQGAYWNEETGDRIDDPDVMALACREGAIGKCVDTGYRPWATGTECVGSGRSKKCNKISLKNHHQACTRMIRADYCGNGTAYTVDGTLLDIFDYLQPPIQLREENWQFEARWNADGAICVTQPRHPELGFKNKCPGKNGKLQTVPACSAYESSCGLIISTFDTKGKKPK